jgi:hypothetical protein
MACAQSRGIILWEQKISFSFLPSAQGSGPRERLYLFLTRANHAMLIEQLIKKNCHIRLLGRHVRHRELGEMLLTL